MITKLDEPLTEKRIALAIMRDRWLKNFCIPNYTPAGWWENDVMEITGAGYWIEYEIKLTMADFRVDGLKTREVYQKNWDAPKIIENKHDLLKNTDRGPSNFYYVAPYGVLTESDLPEWAGLITVNVDGRYTGLCKVKPAPRRHTTKASEELRKAAMETCYYRMHRLL